MKLKKIALYFSFLLSSFTFAFLFYEIVTYFYTSNFKTTESDLSWGVFLYYSTYFGFFISQLLSLIIFNYKKKLTHLPLIILVCFLLFLEVNYRPLRVLLLSLSYIFGHIISYQIIRIGFRTTVANGNL